VTRADADAQAIRDRSEQLVKEVRERLQAEASQREASLREELDALRGNADDERARMIDR